ncbi:hypothetical protein SAMN05660462_00268 [Proteiniborus ethanoligenes]|uniref:Uncharacterized protein n=1 Tax=Proteiniborus ethanoligenes TaxID=415015 RepID=A0A1H3KQZ1_9FIRM|nr:hypothetical protein [Proteiniborus ethanoligenes]TAH63792.1 MAG: hypothetical protein EWM50_01440 [Gottschalkiaceae bacterium]SDY54104.1 hypothetical protein SAMN05660462_00268 [Proteiniborus ethanoligenes]
MRKGIFLSLLLLVVIILISCSNNSKQVPNENATLRSDSTEATDSSTSDSTTEETEKNSGMNVNVSLGTTGENMSLPERFPKDVFPLPEDANIINVNDNKDSKALGIVLETDKSYEEVIEFYQDIMKDGTITVEDKKEDAYVLIGSKNGYGVTIFINKQNNNVGVLIDVTL